LNYTNTHAKILSNTYWNYHKKVSDSMKEKYNFSLFTNRTLFSRICRTGTILSWRSPCLDDNAKGENEERGNTQRIRHIENGRFCKRRFIASVRGRRDVRRHITIIHFVNSAHLYNGFRVRIKSEQLYSFSVAWRESKCLLTHPARERFLLFSARLPHASCPYVIAVLTWETGRVPSQSTPS